MPTLRLDNLSVLLWVGLGMATYASLLPDWIACTLIFALALGAFIRRIEDYIPYTEFAAVIATLQWVLMPLLAYAFVSPVEKYRMYVTADVFFAYALPAVCLMNAALLSLRRTPEPHGTDFKLQYPAETLRHVAALLIGIGLLAQLGATQAPSALGFVFFLLSQLPNVAILILLYHQLPDSRWLITLAGLPLIVSVGHHTMFHSLILWSSFFGLFWMRSRARTDQFKWGMAVLGITGILLLQFFKTGYREELHSTPGMGYRQAVSNAVSLDLVADGENWSQGIMRFNQGWIVSAIMSHVPTHEPHQQGHTIAKAMIDSIVPRALNPYKTHAGGSKQFSRFTGLTLKGNTSMGLSTLGEAYVNFGRTGGILAMGVWGVALACFVHFLSRFAATRPLFHFMIPLILYQGLKAETDFLTVFNQFTKGFALSLLVFWCLRNYGYLAAISIGPPPEHSLAAEHRKREVVV